LCNLSDTVKPFNRLKRKHKKFIWSKKGAQAFQSIIKLLLNQAVLEYLNFGEKFYLCTAASKIGIGAELGQIDR
jgi:hypothetical protein